MNNGIQELSAVEGRSLRAMLDEAWWLLYLDGQRAGALGREALDLMRDGDHPLRGEASFHVAYADIRAGRFETGLEANAQARACFAAQGDARGLLLCDEVEAIRLSVDNRQHEAMRMHLTIAARDDVERPAIDRYISHNSRGLTRKRLGQTDETLQDLHLALDAANQVASPGPRINALCNLGGTHSDLFNHVDARHLSEQAMALSEQVGAWVPYGISALNLIQIYDGLDLPADSLRVVQRLLANAPQLPPRLVVPPHVAMAFLCAGDLAQAQQWLDQGPSAPFGDGDGRTEWAQVQARVHVARGHFAAAREVAENRLRECDETETGDQPYNQLRLLQVAADACEACGDASAALRHLRRAKTLYETMVGRSARARFLAIQAEHELAQAQRERDRAQRAHHEAEQDRSRLAAVNAALQEKIAEAQALQAQLRDQALSDALTGLHNRRYLHEVAPGWLQLAQRKGAAVSLALLDLDHFKHLNDQLGHDTGDLVLQRFAHLLKTRLRGSDIVCRHGGEEFVVIASDADPAALTQVLSALIDECRATTLETPGGRVSGFSFSAGVVACPAHCLTLAPLLKQADQRLYRAKALGRAQVCSADT